MEIACLEITDHSGCVEDHTGGLACERNNYPYGDWAAVGLEAADSANVRLSHWNGCGETYPGGQPVGCWAQTAGGYGDGVGTGETGGNWLIEDSAFLHNSSDGLDLLYTRRSGSSITIRRTIAEGNAGDQIKTTGPTLIENVIAVSNCSFFEGKSFTYNVDNCRAGGSAIALTLRDGNEASIVNATITGQGDCLLITECAEGNSCNGSLGNLKMT